MTKILLNAAVCLTLVFLFSGGSAAQRPFRMQEGYYTGLSTPVFLTNAGDGSRRTFIVEQSGTIKVAQPGSRVLSNYLSVSVSYTPGGERGLLGLAFHPQFEANRRLFVYYTRPGDGAIEIAEYQQNASNRNIVDPTPVRIIITIPHPNFTNHNGGTIAFGPDGYLYAGPGDGGSGNDPNNNAQNINSLLGKMLRIDIDTPLGQVPAYNIPPDNPYAGATPGADEIYAIGLRNPYRFAFDRLNGQLWVADVGQFSIEEVDVVVRGGNYGWRVYEGNQCTGLDPALCSGGATPISHAPPIFQYSSASPSSRCSITGGNIYRGKQNALPLGSYIYGDYCTGEILLWNGSQQTILADTTNFNLVGFGEDEDGEVYVVRLNEGRVDKIMGARTNADFDGDGGTDLSVYRPNNGVWYSLNPTNNATKFVGWGVSIDIPVPDDYDADGKTDHAVFRPSDGVWYYIRSSNGTFGIISWGAGTDLPAPGDFDGDGRADVTVYRQSNGYWYTIRSSDGGFEFNNFGGSEDVPVNGDWDGDGKDDLAIFRASEGNWYGRNSGNGQSWGAHYGGPGDKPTPGDFDGDGRLDLAFYRPSIGTWFILNSSDNGETVRDWGVPTDVPVVGDYDRDNRDDIAVFRPSDGAWYIIRSSDGTFFGGLWGASDDTSLPNLDHP
ncbi:MAG: PQQ-dependent sugar dehydrogenase [Pyrinomonadaceae bacterium]